MQTRLPTINFRTIREHEGSQHRAWEELACILVRDFDALPANHPIERRAAPDGGVEFSCVAPTGRGIGVWAWQAKYYRTFNLNEMTKSVTAALESTPSLSRYSFVVPIDRSAPVLNRWNEKVAEWQAEATKRGMAVDFDFVGHSRVLDALQATKHTGVVRYFFDSRVMAPDSFVRQVERQIANLNDRYSPDVHVPIDIVEVLDAAALSPLYVSGVLSSLRRVVRDEWASRLPPNVRIGARIAHDELTAAVSALAEEVESPGAAQRLSLPVDGSLRGWTRQLELIRALVARAETEAREWKLERPSASNEKEDGAGQLQGAEPFSYPKNSDQLWTLGQSVNAAVDTLSGQANRAATVGTVVLEGPPGCGKSHIVADFALHRAQEGLPTFLAVGQLFGTETIGTEVAKAVDTSLSSGELFDVMEAAAKASGKGRAVLVIDAINEVSAPGTVRDGLAGFLRQVREHPWLAVIVTIRDTFSGALLGPNITPELACRVRHPGLAGHEVEALTRYTKHYGLRLPDFPLLNPELSNPLFLRSLCLSVVGRGQDAIPREAQSLDWVFEGVLLAANSALSKRLDFEEDRQLVRRAVDTLADAMVASDTEYLPLSVARECTEPLLPGRSDGRSLLRGLLDEGILLREPDPDPQAEHRVRFTFQRLSDYLRASRLLAQSPTKTDLSRVLYRAAEAGEFWRSTGLIQALVLAAAEQLGIDLAQSLNLGPVQSRSRPKSDRALRRRWLRRTLADAFFESLPWRSASSITPRTLDLLNAYLRNGVVDRTKWLGILIGLACVPDHPLNAERLHRRLREMTPLEREVSWSTDVLELWWENNGALVGLIEWAWDSPTPPNRASAALAGKVLCWLLASPNRRLRDSATKALLGLVERDTVLLIELLEPFGPQDDPYILERLLALAFGHAVRSRERPGVDLDALSLLGATVFERTFGQAEITPHLMIRQYSRLCLEVIQETLAANARTLSCDLARAAPPYRSQWPLRTQPLKQLLKSHGRPGDRYLTSIAPFNYDFEHYVVERRISQDFLMPNQPAERAKRLRAARRSVTRLRQAVGDSISNPHKDQFARALSTALEDRHRFSWDILKAALTADELPIAQRLEKAYWRWIRAVDDPVHPDHELLSRWIAEESFRMGWRPESFEGVDRRIDSMRHRGSPEHERFGKKYAWIAFYNLLGILSDHCAIATWDKKAVPYDSAWQVGHAIDLDPTLLLRGDEPPEDTAAHRLRKVRVAGERLGKWWMTGGQARPSDQLTNHSWLLSHDDLPRPERLLRMQDPRGRHWLVLELHASWSIPPPGRPDDFSPPWRQIWTRTQAYLVEQASLAEIQEWSPDKNWMGLWMPTPSEGSGGYLGCYPDRDSWPDRLREIDRERQREGTGHALPPGWEWAGEHGGVKHAMALATADHSRGTSRDYSSTTIPMPILPSALLLELLDLRWRPGHEAGSALDFGSTEREYCWATTSDEIAAFSSSEFHYGSPSMLLVREDLLQSAVARTGLSMWAWLLGEKILLGRSRAVPRAA